MSRVYVGPFPLVKLLVFANVLCILTYVTLIAIIMSYAALHISFAEEVKESGAEVASLEATYFASLSELTATDYGALGYAKPITKVFVEGQGGLSAR